VKEKNITHIECLFLCNTDVCIAAWYICTAVSEEPTASVSRIAIKYRGNYITCTDAS